MISKEGPGLYQIGVYSLSKTPQGWRAFSTCALGDYRRDFPSIAAAHLQLTGEPMRRKRFAKISKGCAK